MFCIRIRKKKHKEYYGGCVEINEFQAVYGDRFSLV
jgi:hypothetical protein